MTKDFIRFYGQPIKDNIKFARNFKLFMSVPWKNSNFRKIEKERENDLEQLYSENLENILDHNELRQSLKKSYEVK